MAHAALDFISCFGPGHVVDENAYFFTGSTTGCTLTDPGGGGDFYLEMGETSTFLGVTRSVTVAAKQYSWLVGAFYHNGAVSAGQKLRICNVTLTLASSIHLEIWQNTDTTHFRAHLTDGSRTDLGGGTTDLATGAFHTFRLQVGGGRFKLWVNGTLEIDVADTFSYQINNTYLALFGDDLEAGDTLRHKKYVLCQSDNEQARPNTTVSIAALYPNGNDGGANQNQYDDTTCLTGANGDYTLWDDWATGNADDATTQNCGNAGFAYREISTLGTATVTGIFGCYSRARASASLASKTVTTYTIIRDDVSNEQEKQNVNLGSTAWDVSVAGHHWPTAPDLTSWTQTQVDNLRIGVRHPSTNGANDRWTAIFVEACGIGNDAPAADDRRRTMNQVV